MHEAVDRYFTDFIHPDKLLDITGDSGNALLSFTIA